jgi:hypothetical protein
LFIDLTSGVAEAGVGEAGVEPSTGDAGRDGCFMADRKGADWDILLNSNK